ncbi:hypothetical protein OF829_12115 [Sphingomonas sp. LB-2]|uniref:surface-adhesin E family protein n=1 Tax=Sphingomonas caeni TaxID=2984949 RepID=UPI00222E37C7|nr:surface-adhesin E family protein [Sphingomonas caeni]MCW3847985.1 hypothetical protein [Sphingomonas caeni]
MRFLLGIIALLAATPAFATDWTVVTNVEDRAMVLADRDSVTREAGGTIKVRMLYVMRDDMENMAGLEMVNEFDCSARRYRRVSIRGIDADGALVREEAARPEWRDADPEAVSGTMLDFVCSGTISAAGTPRLGASTPAAMAEARRQLREKR